MAGKKGMRHYSLALKREAVRAFLEEGKTYGEVARTLDIADPQRVKVWVRQFRHNGDAGLQKPIGRPRRARTVQSELEQLRMENALLKKFHSELRHGLHAKRNIGCSTTIA